MVSLAFVICILICIVISILNELSSNDAFVMFKVVSGFCACIIFVWMVMLAMDIGAAYNIDKKIEIYEAENAQIEKNIDEIVNTYMESESETYEGYEDKDSMTLVSLFPELNSDELVTKQIEVYFANNEQIKKLKVEEIEISLKKWELYFGE